MRGLVRRDRSEGARRRGTAVVLGAGIGGVLAASALARHYAAVVILERDRVPDRPNRVEPRAVKRRPKNYQRLTQPRLIFKECPHRNKYRKPLS